MSRAWIAGMIACAAVQIGVGIQSASTTYAQGGRTTAEGVYTQEQAQRGEKTYATACATCHGAQLEGKGTAPALAGMEFEGFWRGQPVGDLFDRISMSMPKNAPGTLMPDQAADVVAYILSAIKEPAGTKALPADSAALGAIKIRDARP